jgi:hypothetical protein
MALKWNRPVRRIRKVRPWTFVTFALTVAYLVLYALSGRFYINASSPCLGFYLYRGIAGVGMPTRSSHLLDWNVSCAGDGIEKWRYFDSTYFAYDVSMVGHFSTAMPAWVILLIPAAMLAKRMMSRKREPSLCSCCGYQLAGLLTTVCPECGNDTDPPSTGDVGGASGPGPASSCGKQSQL